MTPNLVGISMVCKPVANYHFWYPACRISHLECNSSVSFLVILAIDLTTSLCQDDENFALLRHGNFVLTVVEASSARAESLMISDGSSRHCT